MEAVFTSSQPFDEQPLSGAFYYPTQAKDIPFGDNKQCLSPNMKARFTSGADMLVPGDFMTLQSTLQADFIPTKDSGMHANSGSSEFEETWPSTDATESTKAETPLQLDLRADGVYNQANKETGKSIAKQENLEAKSTIARYIHRFRSEPPKSRAERTGDDFWWAKEPSSSSTPKDSDSSTFSPPVQLREAIQRNKSSAKKPPASPEKKTDISGRKIKRDKKTMVDYKQGNDLDSDVDRMQNRAQKLIEISESTLTTSSSDIQALSQLERNKDIVPTASILRSNNVAAKYLTTHSQRPRPEEDILYQWRLARKMEKARQGSGSFSKLPYMQDKIVDGILQSGKDSTHSISIPEKHDKKGEIKEVNPAAIHNDKDLCRMLPNQMEDKKLAGRCRSAKEEMTSTYIHPSIGEVNVSYNNVSAHMHTECDILPCPHRNSREIDICASEGACPKQDQILRRSSSDNPVEIAIPVVGLFASNGTTDIVNERRTEPNLDTGDRLADDNRRFNEREKRLIEPKDKKCIAANEQSTDVSEQKDEKCPSRELREDSTEKEEGLCITIQSSMQDVSIKNNDKKSKIAEAIDEVVSENLFTASLSRNSPTIKPSDSEDPRDTFLSVDFDSSDGEFSDDEVLKILRHRRKCYKQALNEIRMVLDEFPSAED